jgi:hypothetical protein
MLLVLLQVPVLAWLCLQAVLALPPQQLEQLRVSQQSQLQSLQTQLNQR